MNALLPILFVSSVLTAPPTPESIQARVAVRADQIRAVIGQERPAVEAVVTKAIDAILDVPRFGQACLPTSWSGLPPRDRERYLIGFRAMLVRQLVTPLVKDKEVRITVLGSERGDNGSRVRVKVEGRKNTREIVWVFPDDASGKATESIVDDVSQAKSCQKMFERVFRRAGIEGLLERMGHR